MKSRLKITLNSLKRRDQKAMGIFLTSGFPTPDDTHLLLNAIDRGGADFIELGMPHSDPLAEGLPIQQSSTTALQSGATIKNTLEAVTEFRRSSETPLMLMGYINPILRFGIAKFCEHAATCGADGLIIPDLPPQEASLLQDHLQINGLKLVFLVAPNTSTERMKEIDLLSDGFVYCVSITGLTGTGIEGQQSSINSYLKHARQVITRNHLMVGFGIQSFEDAQRLSKHTDGFIVGSAVIKEVERLWKSHEIPLSDRVEYVTQFVSSLKQPPSIN